MKLIEIVEAREPLQKLVEQELPLRVAYRLLKVTEEIKIHLHFYSGELIKLGEYPDPEKLKELKEMEITDLHHARLRVPIMDGIVLSVDEMKKLEPFIEFYEEGEG